MDFPIIIIYEYLNVFIFAIMSFIIATVFILVSYILAPQKLYPEKVSAYECGFEPFDDSRSAFDIQFYVIAILFLIFDLEIAFVFPWAVDVTHLGNTGFWSMMFFLVLLYLGLLYEWCQGALDW